MSSTDSLTKKRGNFKLVMDWQWVLVEKMRNKFEGTGNFKNVGTQLNWIPKVISTNNFLFENFRHDFVNELLT